MLPATFCSAGVLLSENELLLFGGENNQGIWCSDLIVVDLNDVNNSKQIVGWTRGQIAKKDSHCMRWHNGRVLLWGGDDNYSLESDKNQMYQLMMKDDLPQWMKIESSNNPKPRKLCGHVEVGNYWYFFGGKDVSTGEIYDELLRFDCQTHTWENCSSGIAKVYGNVLIHDPKLNRLISFGGIDQDQKYRNQVYQYSTKDNLWIELKTKNEVSPRERSIGVYYDNQLVIHGGWALGGARSDICSLSLSTLEWKTLRENDLFSKERRYGHLGFLVGNELITLSGKDHTFQNREGIFRFKLGGNKESLKSSFSFFNKYANLGRVTDVSKASIPDKKQSDKPIEEPKSITTFCNEPKKDDDILELIAKRNKLETASLNKPRGRSRQRPTQANHILPNDIPSDNII